MWSNIKNESEVIRKVQAGDIEQYEKLIEFYQDRLRFVLSYYCFSSDTVEEIVHEAFVQAYLSIENFDVNKPFFPWLKTIALNKLRKFVRQLAVKRKNADDYIYHLYLSNVIDEDDSSIYPEDKLLALKKCLNKLPAKQFEILQRHYMGDLSFAQLAKIFEKKVSTMKVQVH
ncbi:MAG TPA: sigma-70 family RNA polymerase sigma factor, partial [Victivallales bacterium]|nr:sigma-70 family RNA polymerase sigma factor [Victivallales bacterium]